jgi:hypothetical protein
MERLGRQTCVGRKNEKRQQRRRYALYLDSRYVQLAQGVRFEVCVGPRCNSDFCADPSQPSQRRNSSSSRPVDFVAALALPCKGLFYEALKTRSTAPCLYPSSPCISFPSVRCSIHQGRRKLHLTRCMGHPHLWPGHRQSNRPPFSISS